MFFRTIERYSLEAGMCCWTDVSFNVKRPFLLSSSYFAVPLISDMALTVIVARSVVACFGLSKNIKCKVT